MPQPPTVSADDVQEALTLLRARIERPPETALVLGSGLGALAEAVQDAVVISTEELPGYPQATVAGHSGRLVFGTLEGQPVVVVQGRAHLYEGHPIRDVAFPIRLVHAAGARRLLVTNAAGGINPSFGPGTLMFITDHLNLAFANPLIDPQRRPASTVPHPALRGGPNLAVPYDRAWIDAAERVALQRSVATRRGVYLWTLGPSYETKAEIRMYARMGADAIGMSTVPEVIQARRLGMAVLGISTITNPAAGLGTTPLSHEEVLAVGQQVRSTLERLVRGIMRETS